VQCSATDAAGNIGTAVFRITVDPSYTPPGTDVGVTPPDQTTGQPGPVTTTFSQVTGAGQTTVTSGSVGGGGGPPPPANFRLGSPPTYYDIQTTATFTPPVTVCITWVEGTYNNESQLKLLHFEGGSWQNVTLSGYPDTQNNKICGEVSSLSPFLVAEVNLGPVVTTLTIPGIPVSLGTPVSISAGLSDPNPGDSHNAVIDWDDGTTSVGTVVESNGVGTVSASHVYVAAGVYTITVTVSDGNISDSRSSALNVPAYVVVYDPSAGFVTGGGWIMSPVGAYPAEPALTGKASFGFVAKYAKGPGAPTGTTEFQFRTAAIDFQSTRYEWLVVAGPQAKYRGEGTIRGQSTIYSFLLTAIDGQPSSGGVDRFRIKIWNRTTGTVVYDNQLGQSEDSEASTELGGGSIVIHK
jgi:hypothetical protein